MTLSSVGTKTHSTWPTPRLQWPRCLCRRILGTQVSVRRLIWTSMRKSKVARPPLVWPATHHQATLRLFCSARAKWLHLQWAWLLLPSPLSLTRLATREDQMVGHLVPGRATINLWAATQPAARTMLQWAPRQQLGPRAHHSWMMGTSSLAVTLIACPRSRI